MLPLLYDVVRYQGTRYQYYKYNHSYSGVRIITRIEGHSLRNNKRSLSNTSKPERINDEKNQEGNKK